MRVKKNVHVGITDAVAFEIRAPGLVLITSLAGNWVQKKAPAIRRQFDDNVPAREYRSASVLYADSGLGGGEAGTREDVIAETNFF